MRLQPLTWMMLMGLCTAACADDSDKGDNFGRAPNSVGGDRTPRGIEPTGSSGDAALEGQPATGLDGGTLDAGPGAVGATPPLDATDAGGATCSPGPLEPPPPATCTQPDQAEPNSHTEPAELALGSSCAALTATTGLNDKDAYRFVSTKSDPVRIELSYRATDQTDIWLDVENAAGMTEAFGNAPLRSTEVELIRGAYKPAAGEPHVLRVRPIYEGACQSYTLRLDTQYCTDAYEDNDVEAQAAKLTLDENGKVVVEGTSHQLDSDFYEITTPKADPFRITGTYTAGANDTLVIRRIVSNPAGQSVVDVIGERKALTGTFSHWVDSDSAGGAFKLRLWPSGSGCVPHTVTFDTAACTDAHEDNDSTQAPAKLALATDVQATSISTDRDFYDISELASGGTCTVAYTVAEGSSSKLRANVNGFDGANIANVLGGEGSGATKTMKMSWADRGAARIVIDEDVAGVCQPYTIRCEKTAAPAP